MRARILGIILAAVLAVGGAVVLTGYVSGADSRALANAKPVAVYVVKTTVPLHTPASAITPYLEVRQIPAVAAVNGRVTDLGTLKGMKTNAQLQPGEQLLTARFSSAAAMAAAEGVQLPKGAQAVTVELPLQAAVGGTLQAGDLVGVVIADDAAKTKLAKEHLHKVTVLAVANGNTMQAKGTATSGANVQQITLALKGDAVADLVWGQKWGTVWLAKETKDSDEQSGKSVGPGKCDSTCRVIHP